MKKIKKVIILLILIFITLLTNSIYFANAQEEKNENDNNANVFYRTHVQDIGWQTHAINGAIAGTEGQSKRLEAIQIKTTNISDGAKIKYQVHVQNIGWQGWKENGQLAGTEGHGLRLEAIRIKLENEEKYSIQYRVHVQDIGWQEWKQDGAMAGTEGKSLRLEAIQIKIIPKEEKGIIVIEKGIKDKSYYDKIDISGYKYANVKNTKIKVFIDDNEYTNKANVEYKVRTDLGTKIKYVGEEENSKPGFAFSINTKELEAGSHSMKIQLVTSDETKVLSTYNKQFEVDKNIHIVYKSHVQDIGWQEYVDDENIAGTTGRGLRVEALKIKTYNLPQEVKIKYKTHVQDIGWQSWKNEDEIAGTTGESKRVEGVKIKLENTEDYSVIYRTHVQDIGWQEWKLDGAMAGTEGRSLRVEAIQIKIIPKEEKGNIVIEKDVEDKSYYDKIDISGYKYANVKNTKIKVFIDDNEYTNKVNIENKERTDVKEKINYGGEEDNKKPGFTFSIDTKELEAGSHSMKIQLVTPDETKVLSTYSKQFEVDKDIHILYKSHVQDIGWQDYVDNSKSSGTTGKSLRVEALKIKTYNLPEGVKIKYKTHVQDIGWQSWKNEGEIAGTIGESKRIEGIKIKLENTEDYSVMYRVHVQDLGWQDWVYDGEMAGTTEESKRIEAIEIKIVGKMTEKRTRICLETQGTLTNEVHDVTGWIMTNESNVNLKLLIDNNEINEYISRKRDNSLYNYIKGYGGEELNPQPRFSTNIDFSKYSIGNHIITLKVVSENGNILKETSNQITIVKKIEHYRATYGYSATGDALDYLRYGNGPNVFFATFCVHGFEDNWPNDGYELVDIAYKFYDRLVSMNDYGIADKWTIYIIQCVNIDGVKWGYTNDGPGRTTLTSDVGKGIDLNRCWSTGFVPITNSNRNYTGNSPFLAIESRYLRDFMLSHKSNNGKNVVVDLHGWTQQLIGDPDLRDYYRTQFPENLDTSTYGKGYLINWARENLNAKSALIELPKNNYSHNDVVTHNLANRYMEATLSMLRGL